MNPFITFESVHEQQPVAAQAMDETLRSNIARLFNGLSPIALALAHADWALHMMAAPGRQAVLAQRAVDLSLCAMRNLALPPDAGPHDKNARFADPAWDGWPYKLIKESYKVADTWWREVVQHGCGISQHQQHMVSFFTGQTLDALSPSNWLLTNPGVLRVANETQGESLQQGSCCDT